MPTKKAPAKKKTTGKKPALKRTPTPKKPTAVALVEAVPSPELRTRINVEILRVVGQGYMIACTTYVTLNILITAAFGIIHALSSK